MRNLRPREAADSLGVSLSTFYRLARTESDFPKVIQLTSRCSVVREQDLVSYMDKRATQANAQPAGVERAALEAA